MRLRDSQQQALSGLKIDTAVERLIAECRNFGFQARQGDQRGEVFVIDALGNTTKAHIGADGLTLTTPERRAFAFGFDAQGNVSRITAPASADVLFTHDQDGRLTEVRRGSHRPYRFAYDEVGRLSDVRFPDDTVWSLTRDDAARRVTTIDRNGRATMREFSEDGLLLGIVDPNGHHTRFDYQQVNAPSAIVFANGDRQQFEYDTEGSLVGTRVNGEPHAKVEVDARADAVTIRYADGTFARFAFRDGLVVEATNETCTVALKYDEKGNVVEERTGDRIVRYSRDAVGAITAMRLPGGETIRYTRDRDQQVVGIEDWTGGHYRVSYHPSGVLASVSYPNEVASAFDTTDMGLPARLVLRSQGIRSSVRQELRWWYDERDRLIESADGERRETYQYDGESRLLSVDSRWPASYAVDASGNRTADGEAQCVFNGRNQLVSRNAERFRYDALGNMIEGRVPRGPARCTFNQRNQLVAVDAGGTTTTYGYDAFGRRVFKRRGADAATTYTWAGAQIVSETEHVDGRTSTRDYLAFPGTECPLAMRLAGTVYYVHFGRRGEPLWVTDSSGAIGWSGLYDAFGQLRSSSGALWQPWRLRGQYFDDETGLHYAVARYYDPRLGRYLSIDPLYADGGSLNFYAYCDGEPFNRCDPTGEFIIPAVIPIALLVGAAISGGLEIGKQLLQRGEVNDWGAVGKEALIGGACSAIGAGVGGFLAPVVTKALAPVAGTALSTVVGNIAAGVASGAVSSCTEAALRGKAPDLQSVAAGALTSGVLGLWKPASLVGQAAKPALTRALKPLTRTGLEAVKPQSVVQSPANKAEAAAMLKENAKARDMATLASDVYDRGKPRKVEKPGGWTRASGSDALAERLGFEDPDVLKGLLEPTGSGFRAEIYEKDGKVVLAFKGTTMDSVEDWRNNIAQGLGFKSDYYQRALDLAKKLDDNGVDFETTGHSLGGGMAAAAAMSVGQPATTFNAASVHPNTVQYTGDAAAMVRDIRVEGELLNTVQAGSGFLPPSVGRQEVLPATDPSAGGVARHEMDAVMQSLDAQQEDCSNLLQAP